jgi:hypothetical protein
MAYNSRQKITKEENIMSEETSKNEEKRLSSDAVVLINAEVDRILKKYAKFIGISSLLVFISGAIYILFLLPNLAAKIAITTQVKAQEKLQSAITDTFVEVKLAKRALSEAIKQANAAQEDVERLRISFEKTREQINALEKSLKEIEEQTVVKAIDLIEKFKGSDLEKYSDLIPVFQSGVESKGIKSIDIHKNEWTLNTGDGTRKFLGYKKFDNEFASPPIVVVGLNSFDGGSYVNRLTLAVTKVKKKGFYYVITTWHTTTIVGIQFSWLAIGTRR